MQALREARRSCSVRHSYVIAASLIASGNHRGRPCAGRHSTVPTRHARRGAAAEKFCGRLPSQNPDLACISRSSQRSCMGRLRPRLRCAIGTAAKGESSMPRKRRRRLVAGMSRQCLIRSGPASPGQGCGRCWPVAAVFGCSPSWWLTHHRACPSSHLMCRASPTEREVRRT